MEGYWRLMFTKTNTSVRFLHTWSLRDESHAAIQKIDFKTYLQSQFSTDRQTGMTERWEVKTKNICSRKVYSDMIGQATPAQDPPMRGAGSD